MTRIMLTLAAVLISILGLFSLTWAQQAVVLYPGQSAWIGYPRTIVFSNSRCDFRRIRDWSRFREGRIVIRRPYESQEMIRYLRRIQRDIELLTLEVE